jgi:hypothetical protein
VCYRSFEGAKAAAEKAKKADEQKSVIPFASHTLADLDAPWNGAAQVAGADIDDLKIMCAWYDAGKPDVKGAYKLPHHTNDDYKTVWNGVKAAMNALLGGRGGVDMPEGDRKGVYAHLKKHYAEFDKVAPEYKEYALLPSEMKSIIEKVDLALPGQALDTLYFAMRQELYNQAVDNIEKTVEQVANDTLSEAIDLMLPYMTAYAKACRDRIEKDEQVQEVVAKTFEEMFNTKKTEPPPAVVPAPAEKAALFTVKEPPAPEKIVFADDVKTVATKDTVTLPCTLEELQSLLKELVAASDVKGSVEKELRKLQGKLD